MHHHHSHLHRLHLHIDEDESDDDATDTGDNGSANDDSIPVDLAPGEDDLDNDFIEEQLGSICGNVSEDTNNDDAGDTSLEDITITLTDVDSDATSTTTTDENGDYCFEGLETGMYTVEEDDSTLPDTYVDVNDEDESDDDATDTGDNGSANDDVIPVDLAPGEDDLDNDFIEEQLGSICGNVSEDTNNDDAGDTGLEGITITLTDVDSGATSTTTTDENGDYCFEGLETGMYTVEEDDSTLPDTYVDVNDEDESDDDATDTGDNGSANDDSIPVDLAPGEDDLDNDFIEEQLGSICGNVSEDTNNDDAGDTGLEGITITLTDVDSGATSTTTTDENGDYCFEGLETGMYTVEEDDSTLPDTYVDVNDEDESDDDATDTGDNGSANDDSIPVDLAPGEDDLDNDFIEEQLGSICGNVSEDTNNDDAGDTGLEGITITLTDVDSGATSTTTTDENGDYCFEGLETGMYTVEEDDSTLPDTYVDVNDEDESDDDATDTGDNGSANDDVIPVDLAPGEDDLDNDFIEEQLGSICGNVSEDTNNDDAGDTGLEGITITLTDVDSGATSTTTTDENGDYCFEGLETGMYTVEEDDSTLPDTYVDVNDEDESDDDATDTGDNGSANDDVIPVDLAPGEDDLDNDFIEEQLGSICGNVSEDTNNDDAGDTGLEGITITLTDVDSGATSTTTTDENGDYCFEGLETGMYTVEEDDSTLPDTYVDVNDEDESDDDATDTGDNGSANDDSIPVDLAPGEDDLDNDFIEEQLGSICGNVSEDTNNDDAGDTGLEGITITLTDVDSGATSTTTTDENGDYCFEGLETGMYTVEEDDSTLPDTYVDVNDEDESDDDATDTGDNGSANDDSIPVDLAPGEDDLDNDFIEEQLGSICGNVSEDTNNDDAGDTGLEGITITLTDVDSGATSTTTTDENGDYCFEGLETGMYTVEEDDSTLPDTYVDVNDEDESDDDATDTGDNGSANDDVIPVDLAPGEDDLDNDFIEEQLGSICGNVSEDTNNDDAGDTGLEGITITLTDVDSGATSTTTTDENGDYCFEGLETGMYTVEEDDSTLPDTYVDVKYLAMYYHLLLLYTCLFLSLRSSNLHSHP